MVLPSLCFCFLVLLFRIHLPQSSFIGFALADQIHGSEGGEHGMVHVVVPVLAVPAHAVEIGDGVQFLPEPGKIPVAAIIGRVGFFQVL